jgi:Spy/CpxP family protein refolding chaperone
VKLSRLTIALYVGLIFASGVVLGVFGHSLYAVTTVISKGGGGNPKAEEVRKKTLAEMQSRMKLSDDQVAKINSILDETRARFHEVRERYRPQMDEIQKNQRDKVRTILSPEQRAEYEKMLKEREEHQKKENGERGPGPGI